MRLLLTVFFIAYFIQLVICETHTWNFTTGWVDANPDGCYDRKVIGFNGEWPLPTLRVKKGDRVNLYLTNGFEDVNTTLHFHGLFQPGSNQMDGPEMVTQCPIPPGETFLYNFTVGDQVGTYWYHSHTATQYGDGMRGIFIIEDDIPYEYDEEVVLTVAEWYHKNGSAMKGDFLSLYNPTGAEPIPQNALWNETRNGTWHVEPNKTYLLRIINVGRFVSHYLYMEDHSFDVIEVDGNYVEKNTTDMIYITTAQRYLALVTTKNDTSKNYAFMQKIDDTMLDLIPPELQLNGTNTISYDDDNDEVEQYMVDELEFLDDFYLKPLSNATLLEDPDYKITVDVLMNNLGNGINYAFFNNITYTAPKIPTLLTALSAGEDNTNPLVYGTNINAFVLQEDDVVEIVLNNEDTGTHPFHLHGHAFQVINRYKEIPETEDPVPFNESDHDPFPEYPMIRDTLYVRPQSHFVIRFKADHPGVWFFHCHLEWHLEQGLAIVLIEAPESLRSDPEQQLTENHKDICKKAGIPIEGNAAANSKDFLDLTSENVQHPPLPDGFTARGIVALVFSCIAAILGLIVIGIYGMADIKDVEHKVAEELDVEIDEQEPEVSSESVLENSKKQ